MKKISRLLLVVIMLLCLFSTAIYAGSIKGVDNKLTENENLSKLIPVVSLDVGESGVIEYDYNVEGLDLGPTEFEVLPNGEFAVLDLVGEQVIFCSEDDVTAISIEEYDVADLYYDGVDLLIHCDNNAYIPINDEGISNCVKENVVVEKIADKSVLELIDKENKYVNLLRCDEKGCFYTYEQSYNPDSSVIWFEDSVCKYDSNGELVGYAIYDTDECVTYPNRPVNVDADGNIYVMLCKEEQVVIYKVIIGCGDKSTLEEKTKKLELEYGIQEERSRLSELASASTMASTSTTAPSYSRYQAFLRAIGMTRLTWTVTSENKDTSSFNGTVTLPAYVANAKVGATVSGIPYCWGGFNGYASNGTSQSQTKYSEVCTWDVVAGNVNTSSSGRVYGTVGLDCSGFVSSVYGFTTKKNSSYFTTYGTLIDKSEMRYMDILVKNGHVMIYGGEYEYELADGSTEIRWTIYDASTDTGKTAERVVKQSDCNSYIARNPWND